MIDGANSEGDAFVQECMPYVGAKAHSERFTIGAPLTWRIPELIERRVHGNPEPDRSSQHLADRI